MRTHRAIVLIFVSFIVSAMVAGTTFAQPAPAPDPSATPTPPTLDPWQTCLENCKLAGVLGCASVVDIKTACASVPECLGLTPPQAADLNGFCNQCMGLQAGCDATPPATTPTPTKPTPTAKSTNPITPEQYCKAQGGYEVDGVCMTFAKMAKEIVQLRNDAKALETRADITDIQIADLKKRQTGFENVQGMPVEMKQYLKDVLEPNLKWVNDKFEQIEYRMGEQDVARATISQRVDNIDHRLGTVEKQKSSSSGWLGIEASIFADMNTLMIADDREYRVGGEFSWAPTIYGPLRAILTVGGAYAGDSPNGSLKTIRIEAGVSAVALMFLHVDGGFRTDQTLQDLDLKHSAFYGAYLTPRLCLPWQFTVCLGASAAFGSLTYVPPSASRPVTDFTAEIGGALTFGIQQDR